MLRSVPNQFEPTLSNRFELQFPQELDIPSWLVQTSDRPSYSQNAVEIPYFYTSSYVGGRYKWNTMTFTFINPIGPSTEQKLMEWSRLHFESLTGRGGYAFGYLKDIILKTLDPTGVPISQWKLYQCLITEFSAGDSNDHANDELIKPTITVQPYYCEQEF